MDSEELLRRLALNDEQVVRTAMTAVRPGSRSSGALDDKTTALVRLAALLAVGAPTVACRATVEAARESGATPDDLVDVLLTVGPVVGAGSLVAAAPRLALAIDVEIEGLDSTWQEDV